MPTLNQCPESIRNYWFCRKDRGRERQSKTEWKVERYGEEDMEMEPKRRMKTNRGGGEKQTAPIKLSPLVCNWKIWCVQTCLNFFITFLEHSDKFGRSLRSAVKLEQCVWTREHNFSDVTLCLWCQPCPVRCGSDGYERTRAEWVDSLSRQSRSVNLTTKEWVRMQSAHRLTGRPLESKESKSGHVWNPLCWMKALKGAICKTSLPVELCTNKGSRSPA